jgi:coenzyme F420-reducing hydrogenase gamma subunit
MNVERTYLGVPVDRPRVAFFELTSCEGCQLQILNNEESLLDFLALVEPVNFREAMDERSDVYEIAFVEGSVTREDEVQRLLHIRERAKLLVAFGSCACFGGVNQLKNRFVDPDWAKRRVYGDFPVESGAARPLEEVVQVDLHIYGCPVKKEEVERLVTELLLGKSLSVPKYPVCMECKAQRNLCLFELGEVCLGPVTRAGCGAWCPSGRMSCWGCRGPSEPANLTELAEVAKRFGLSEESLLDHLECFGGFAGAATTLRRTLGDPGGKYSGGRP